MCLLACLVFAAGWRQRGGLGVVRRGQALMARQLSRQCGQSSDQPAEEGRARGGRAHVLLLSLGVLCLVQILVRSPL